MIPLLLILSSNTLHSFLKWEKKSFHKDIKNINSHFCNQIDENKNKSYIHTLKQHCLGAAKGSQKFFARPTLLEVC